MTKIRVRILTPGEEKRLRRENQEKIRFSGPLAILGPSDHLYVTSTVNSDNVKSYYVNLGGGQYIDDVMGCIDPEEGLSTPDLCITTLNISYIVAAAQCAKVPLFRGKHLELLYFQNFYSEAFIRGMIYVDKNIRRHYASRSFLDRIFGGLYGFEWNSNLGIEMRQELTKIFNTYHHNYRKIGS